jgi:energy-coupling factor transporter ATP-binding protein EcfA2
MENLSGGLRSCVIFAKITYICPHLLIMDEPTNFLDLESIDSLILATNKYHGALLLVSHNRLFLNKCAKQFLSIVPGRFEVFNDLKTCERSTYQFIEEMESGVKVGAQDLVAKNPSADAAMSVRAGEAAKKLAAQQASKDGVLTISNVPDVKQSLAKKVEIKEAKEEKAPEGNLVGKKCTALWAQDGGKYPAVVLKVISADEIQVVYTGYNNTAIVKMKDVTFDQSAPSSKSGGGKSGASQSGRKGGGQGHYQQKQGGGGQGRQSRGPRRAKARAGSERE